MAYSEGNVDKKVGKYGWFSLLLSMLRRGSGDDGKTSGPRKQLLDFLTHPARTRPKLWLKIIHE
jgi:hypothetical protein